MMVKIQMPVPRKQLYCLGGMQKERLVASPALDNAVMHADVGGEAEPRQHGRDQRDDSKILRRKEVSEYDLLRIRTASEIFLSLA